MASHYKGAVQYSLLVLWKQSVKYVVLVHKNNPAVGTKSS